MPKVTISHQSKSQPKEAFAKIQQFLEGVEGIKKLDSKAQFQFDPATLSGKAKGGQFSASFQITPDAGGSKIDLVIDLSLLLTPLRNKIQESISHQLTKFVS